MQSDAELHAPAECASSSIVAIEDLTVRRGADRVLDGVTICIDEGTFTGVLGPNGGGKTTLLKVLLGLLPYESGRVRVLGREPSDLGPMRARIGYVPQHLNVETNFPASALSVAAMGAYRSAGLFRPLGRRWRDRAMAALRRVGMAEAAHRPFGRLSGGQRQRALIARAIVAEPRLLLFDEPTTGVDVKGQEQLMDLLRDLRREMDLTILMVTHDVALISRYADRIACLNRVLHWHDASERLTPAVLDRAFQTNLDYLLAVQHAHDHDHEHGHAHDHESHGKGEGEEDR